MGRAVGSHVQPIRVLLAQGSPYCSCGGSSGSHRGTLRLQGFCPSSERSRQELNEKVQTEVVSGGGWRPRSPRPASPGAWLGRPPHPAAGPPPAGPQPEHLIPSTSSCRAEPGVALPHAASLDLLKPPERPQAWGLPGRPDRRSTLQGRLPRWTCPARRPPPRPTAAGSRRPCEPHPDATTPRPRPAPPPGRGVRWRDRDVTEARRGGRPRVAMATAGGPGRVAGAPPPGRADAARLLPRTRARAPPHPTPPVARLREPPAGRGLALPERPQSAAAVVRRRPRPPSPAPR